jgi:selenide,water dikinase
VLYLTKSLGMGSMTTAGKFGKATPEAVRQAALQMATLNAGAAEAMNAVGAHACTDITGFGLVGHARNIALASGVTLRLRVGALPIFPGALELARAGVVSGGSNRGKATLADVVTIDPAADKAVVSIAFDAETSGGLLICVAADRAAALERELAARGVPIHAVGEAVAGNGPLIQLLP